MTRIAINGFGRIGRLAFRAAFDRAAELGLEIAAVNEPKGGIAAAAHLLEFDSVHGRWDRGIATADGDLVVDGRRIAFSEAEVPQDCPWAARDVAIALDCSGRFLTPEALGGHLAAGARKVAVAAPVKSGALNVVVGINDDLVDPRVQDIVTAASCTTNCLAPVVKVVQDGLGIRHGVITTIHDVTNTQVIVDAPHKDLRRARSALTSLVPTSTGSATAIGLIYPELQGRLNGIAVRVPLLNASLTDCVFEVGRPTDVETVNGLLRAAAEGPLAGILGYETRPLVSVDFRGDRRSAIVDSLSTMVVDGTQVKILAWYDNETGYAHRLVELAAILARRMAP